MVLVGCVQFTLMSEPTGEAPCPEPTEEKPWAGILREYADIKAKEARLAHSYEEYMDPARGSRPVPEHREWNLHAMFTCLQSHSLGKDKIINDLIACMQKAQEDK